MINAPRALHVAPHSVLGSVAPAAAAPRAASPTYCATCGARCARPLANLHECPACRTRCCVPEYYDQTVIAMPLAGFTDAVSHIVDSFFLGKRRLFEP